MTKWPDIFLFEVFFFWSFNPTGSNNHFLSYEFDFFLVFIYLFFVFLLSKKSYSLKKLWKFSTRSFGIGWLIRWTSYHQNIEIPSKKLRNKLSLSANLDWIFQKNHKSQAWYYQMLQRDIFWKVINYLTRLAS